MNTFSLSSFDPRLKIATAAVIGVITWHVPLYALLAYTTGIIMLAICNASHITLGWRTILTYSYFIVGWAGLKFALACTPLLQGISPAYGAAALDAAVLGLRLFILIGIGLLLASTTSARQLGLALSWFLRPLLGKRSWEPALSMALMIHFIPLIQKTFSQVLRAMKLRNPQRTRFQRFLLVPQAVLRICAQKTWTQTIAVAARKLDTPTAWEPDFTPCYGQFFIFLLIITASLLPLLYNWL
ncbi:MAG: energy-coupling factor transporter transmembrane protein EcfT [Desulfovibrionales bacterium]|nr:energy-coupling factor transporter transmembrane protein EcfT [Desulfovibrionales bacterium]